jgi:hypothetical protein
MKTLVFQSGLMSSLQNARLYQIAHSLVHPSVRAMVRPIAIDSDNVSLWTVFSGNGDHPANATPKAKSVANSQSRSRNSISPQSSGRHDLTPVD